MGKPKEKLQRESGTSVDLLKDPKFKKFIDQCTEHEKTLSPLPYPEQRKLDAEFLLQHTKCHESVHQIANLEIKGKENHKIPLRIYVPNTAKNLPVMVYFHGGGWVYGGIAESDAVCRRLANHLGYIIASVGYRLAPEHPFPQPLEDCYAATLWMAENAHLFSGNKNPMIVCGESAGGNLAAAVALMARDKQGPKLAAQLLLYPAITSTLHDDIYDKCPDHYFMTQEAMQFFLDMYMPNPQDKKNPYASLDYAKNLHGLPPAFVVTAEYDPLRFEAEQYAMLLQNAGVRVATKMFSKLVHAFLYIPLYEEEQKVQWTKEIGVALREL
jgi:acetyl esterase